MYVGGPTNEVLMSATGQGGVTVIAGRNHSTLYPVAIPSGFELVFAHNVGRRAFSVIVTSGDPSGNYGQVLTAADNVFVTQPDVNTIRVAYTIGAAPELVFISCRWEEPTPELNLVVFEGQGGSNDPRISIVALPPEPN